MIQMRHALFAAILAASASFSSWAAPEHDLLAALDGLCIASADNPPALERSVRAMGGKELPAEVANADPAIAANGGRMFGYRQNGNVIMVALSKPGFCSVASTTVDPEALRSLALTSYTGRLIDVDNEGPQMREMFELAGSNERSLLMIVRSKPGFEQSVSIGFVSSKSRDAAKSK